VETFIKGHIYDCVLNAVTRINQVTKGSNIKCKITFVMF